MTHSENSKRNDNVETNLIKFNTYKLLEEMKNNYGKTNKRLNELINGGGM